ncbi:hypothetical protein CO613_11440 [Lysobacteraceae bacterium NML07-0707]|nr:hypothetical protein CO613_11440 [Xanthomonadaceae bacterium NML07-0707]
MIADAFESLVDKSDLLAVGAIVLGVRGLVFLINESQRATKQERKKQLYDQRREQRRLERLQDRIKNQDAMREYRNQEASVSAEAKIRIMAIYDRSKSHFYKSHIDFNTFYNLNRHAAEKRVRLERWLEGRQESFQYLHHLRDGIAKDYNVYRRESAPAGRMSFTEFKYSHGNYSRYRYV